MVGGLPMSDLKANPVALPVQAGGFVGRHAESAEIGTLLAGPRRLLTLVGVGGIGKTRLAVRVAATWSKAESANAVFVDLAALEDPKLVETALLEAAGIPVHVGRSPLQVTINQFASERALVVLDNCEHLTEEAARVATELVARCPAVRVLATSREPLGVPGEVTWPVPPLALDAGPAAAGMSEAAQLFTERLPRGVAKYAMDRTTVERLVRELEGIPLAIELAAAGARPLPATVTEDPRQAPDGVRRPERHETMRRSLDWSHALLTEHEALLFRRLSVFVSGWTLKAAEFVCADERLPIGVILDALTALTDKSLVVVSQTGGHSRFHMLSPVRQYAEELVATAAEDSTLALRHRHFFVDVAQHADRELWALDLVGRTRLDEESPNLRAALDHACRHDDAPDALRLAASLALYWRVRGRLFEGAETTGRALATTGAGESVERALALAMHATLVFWLGRLDETVADAEEAIRVAEAVGDLRAHAHALARLGTARMMMAPREAQPSLERAAEMARTADDPVARSDALSSLAMSYHWQDDYRRMAETADEGDAVAGRIGFDSVLFWNLWGRAHQARIGGDFVAARRLAHEFATLTVDEDALLRSAATEIGVLVEAMQGDPAKGRAAATAELERSVHEAARWGTGMLEHALGVVELAADRFDAARAWGEGIYEQESRGSGYLAWHSQEILMLAALACGDHAGARSHAALIRIVAERLGNRRALAVANIGEARAALMAGDVQEAETRAHEVLPRCVEQDWWIDVMTALEVLAMAAVRRGQHDRATRLFAGVGAARRSSGMERVPREASFWDEQIATAASGLDGAGRSAAETAGATMSLSELAEYVGRGRGTKKDQARNPFRLTPMESRVAELAARGLSNQDIAHRLFIARGTVKSHMAHIFAKLGVGNRTELTTALGRAREERE